MALNGLAFGCGQRTLKFLDLGISFNFFLKTELSIKGYQTILKLDLKLILGKVLIKLNLIRKTNLVITKKRLNFQNESSLWPSNNLCKLNGILKRKLR